MIYIIMLIIAIASLWFLFHPVFGKGKKKFESKEDYIDDLIRKKEILLKELRDLELDFKAGKFDESDYIEMREELENEVIEIIRKLEDMGVKT